jgi:hypothetical protein
MLNIDFSFDTQYGNFSDSIWLPEDHTLSDDDIEAMKQQRLSNWMAIIENPPVASPAPTITIGTDTYTLVLGTPTSGNTLVQVGSNWYQKD